MVPPTVGPAGPFIAPPTLLEPTPMNYIVNCVDFHRKTKEFKISALTISTNGNQFD